MRWKMTEQVAKGAIVLRDYSRSIKERDADMCGPYYFIPGPLITGHNAPEGIGGYLNMRETMMDSGAFVRLRVRKASDYVQLRHTGWYTDEFGEGDTLHGLVALLPHGRYLAGCGFGGGMWCSFSRDIYDDPQEAARAADREAEMTAEREREEDAKTRAEDAADEQRA